jgi:serine phosphatase RsbU (regulator of sigma subunit)/ABC-type antimicrobial peptide transport system permease subunit
MVSLAGAAGGILVSYGLVRFVLSVAAAEIPRGDEIAFNWTVLAAALATAGAASSVFSLAPLWQAVRTQPNEVLTDGVRASAGARTRGLSRSLVIAEIALAFTVLSASALLLAQLSGLSRVDPGFNPDHLLTFRLSAPESASQNLSRYQARLLLALNRTPGIAGAAFANQIPLLGCCYTADIFPEGGSARPANVDSPSLVIVSKGYFRTMQIPVLQGRVFDERDVSDTSLVALIDESLARHYWPGRDPVGKYARFLTADGIRFQVIGIVGSVKNKSLQDQTTPEIFLSSQVTSLHQMEFVVRSPMPTDAIIRQVRAAVQSVNPQQPIYETKTMQEVVRDSIAQQRLQSFMVSFFAAAALLMVTLGVYGVVSYAMRQRTVELGTRMAIGATGQDLFRLVIADGLKMAFYGVVAGGIVVAVVTALLKATVFGIRIDDPRPFLFSMAGIAGLTTLACAFPAWRAMLIAPMVAIRNDPGSIWQNTRQTFQRLKEQVTGLVSPADEQAAESESELMASVADAGRHAGSFHEALEASLSQLRERIRADAATLFVQKAPGYPYRSGTWTLPADALLVSRLRHYSGVLSMQPSDLDATEVWTRENAPEHLDEIATLRELGPAAVVRVAVKDGITGLLFAGSPVGRAGYSPLEKRLLRGVAAQFAMMLEISTLTERIGEQDRLRRELALAGEVQRRLFPERFPETANLAFAGVCIPARGVGGDYFDFLDLGGRNIGVALADVAGKGIAAALVMSVVQASLRSLTCRNGTPLIEIAATMNGLLHRSTGANSYATFFYAEVDEERRELRYVNAGHNPPYLLRVREAAVPIEELTTGGTIIGMFAQSTYEEGTVHLHPGDLLIAFTDGVPEALDPKEEEFGEERLKEILRAVAHLPVDEMAARIVSELKRWISDAAQYDDMTFILMKVN